MSKKSNHRSIRYSDEVAAIVENFGLPGGSFNDKLEQLILHCNLILPQIDADIARKKKELAELEAACRAEKRKTCDHRVLRNELDVLSVDCHRLSDMLKNVSSVL